MGRVGSLSLALLLLAAPSVLAAGPQPLRVHGFRPAAVLVAGKPGPRPLAVGLHGNFDRPEWFCGALEGLLAGRAHAVCPRGQPRGDVPREYDRWTFPARGRVLAELEAGIRALKERQGVSIADGPVLLAGFSLGAIIAARLAVEEPARFPRLYLVEGAQAVWTPEALRRFGSKGGVGMVFGCGGAGCAAQAQRVCKEARRRKLSCEVVTAKGLGHSYTEPLPDLARPHLDALLAGDRRW